MHTLSPRPFGQIHKPKISLVRVFAQYRSVSPQQLATLAHRLLLRPELWVRRVRTEDVVAELLEQVPTPPPEAEPAAVPSRQGG
jgi:hypothetical protein